MIDSVEVPLDSYRLANYAVQVRCYVCEGGNTFDAETCRHCHAPMALAHQASSQNLQPRMVAALGSAGAGKTVFLGMLLDMLSRQSEQHQLLARGAFSITLQQQTVAALADCRFPDKTPSEPDRWNWVHCQIQSKHRKRPIDFMMPDMAGDAIHEELKHPHSYPVIRSFLKKCKGMMIFVDAAELASSRSDEDYFAMKLLSYISELDVESKRRKPLPLAIVLTKCDERPEAFDDAAAFAQRHATGLWQHSQQRSTCLQFFAASVAGTCTYRRVYRNERIRVPLRIEPRGVVQPFIWLLDQMKK